MRYEFATATQIVFGAGTLAELPRHVRPFGRKILVVTGANPSRAEKLLSLLQQENFLVQVAPVAGEPTLGDVERLLDRAREFSPEAIIALGGGSVIDAGKALAGLFTNAGTPLEYLEIVGRGQPLTQPALPFVAIPTTAGTGAEVTRNAVLSIPERQLKVSLRSPLLLPRLALVDPELALDLPPALTAATGFDALTQLIEAYVSCRANPHTDALCEAGIPLAATALPLAFRDPKNLSARTALAQAALWSGMALANAGLGAVHGFASPIGGRFCAPHGAVCAALLGPVLEINLNALQQREPENNVLKKFVSISAWLTKNPHAKPKDGIAWVHKLTSELSIPRLSQYGLSTSNIPEVAALAHQASSMKGNPIALTPHELGQVLNAAL